MAFNPILMRRLPVFAVLLAAVTNLHAQAKSDSTAEPDVLIFTDGEKLIGHLVRSTGDKVTFKSDMAGEITVGWKNIQELRSAQKYAVIQKGVPLRKNEALSLSTRSRSVLVESGHLKRWLWAMPRTSWMKLLSSRRCTALGFSRRGRVRLWEALRW
jgi:hypothetical protein